MSDVLCVTAKLDCQCPLWVRSGHQHISAGCPLYPQKRTLVERVAMSALYHKQTFRTAAKNVDHLVGAREQLRV